MKQTKSSFIKIRVSEEEHERIDQLADQRNLSVSEYVRNCSLNEKTIVVVDRAPIIIQHLSRLSDLVNSFQVSLQPRDQEELKNLIHEEVRELWQSLK